MTALRLEPYQARTRPLTSYEHAFADELEAIYGRGVHDLDGLVAALNETGVRPAGGADWSAESLCAELARLAGEG
ncbi:recombinase-like helix-turn-helix domain-containing protein [Pseudonocardia acaciae]|uniref:recombinase-like helix-turn-helix domain-containing protein n=1 Tax=Pseudonocardia acaciae TaxID=551276 RepID=UPI000562C5B8|nr:recombinase-like helix-turn-helix domain-containing protein [Pseudonocardia acaciae]